MQSALKATEEITSPMTGNAPEFVPTRAEAEERLQHFVSRAGADYTHSRNYDQGPYDRTNVSCLSPYLSRRMVLEETVVRSVLQVHSEQQAEKFIQEICWRAYWIGWLALRPKVWADYTQDLASARSTIAGDPALRERYLRAVSGTTGIDCFDAWVAELTDHGYLHNHARMWFASIWIFTLQLPWVLGAELFYRLLLDANPASNTLSWRWVAGLHTRGKHYVARAENIAKYTHGRFNPAGQLNENPLPKSDPRTYKMLLPTPLPEPQSGRRTGWLVTSGDLSAAYEPVEGLHADCLAFLKPPSDLVLSKTVRDFNAGALRDASAQAERRLPGAVDAAPKTPEEVVRWAGDCEVKQVVAVEGQVGETATQLSALQELLAHKGIPLYTVRRRWDSLLFPHATRGYFPFRRQIPQVLQAIQQS